MIAIFTAAGGIAWFGETLSIWQMLGALLILASAIGGAAVQRHA